jgi:hypothetical protein
VSDPDLARMVAALASAEIGRRDALLDRPLEHRRWSELETRVRAERLEPQLARAVELGVLAADEQQADRAESLHQSAMATALLLDRLLLTVAERFDAASIPFAVLKGPAVAHLDYPDPARRAYGDVDVLVPSARIDRAVACLEATGSRRSRREPRPGFDRRFGKGMSFRVPTGGEVDVHRTLTLGPFGLAIDLDDLWAGRESFRIGGRELDALDRPRRFLHACLHAELGRARSRLVPLMDLVMTAPRSDSEAGAVVALARRWQCDAVVLAAVAAAAHRLRWSPPAELTAWMDRLGPSARQRRWMAGYRGDRRSSARLTLTATEALDGWGERLDYLRAVLWPSGTTMATRTARFRRGLSSWSRRSS